VNELQTRHLLTLRPAVGPALELGPTPRGIRRTVPVIGGSFDGPNLRGRILPGGADWAFTRPDGVLELDVRLTAETDDGALIHVTYRGVRHGPAEVLAAIIRGEVVDPASYYFRIVPTFETSAPAYAYLNRLISVGVGVREPTGPIYTIHEVL